MAASGPFSLDLALDRAREQPGSRRAALLREAERLFAQRGYERVTVRDVAAAAGVNVATLHLHWKNKATLYEAVCRSHARYLLSFIERVREETASEGLSAAEQLGRWVDHAVDLMVARPSVAPLALEGVSGQAPPDLPTLFQHDVAVFRLVADEIGAALTPGREEEVEPMLVVLAIFYLSVVAFSDGPVQQALLGGSVYESEDLQARFKKFGRLLLRQLVAPSEERP
jgi:AcrR family transcriptional regulator